MLFKDVIGQHEVKQQLVETVQHNRLSHALLFLGKEGSGALPLAIAFAQYVSLLPNKDQSPGASLFGEPDRSVPRSLLAVGRAQDHRDTSGGSER